MNFRTKRLTLSLKLIFILILCICAVFPAFSCTSLLVGKKASADGSTMITYAADSHVLYGELYSQPAKNHAKGAMREIREWDTNKRLGEIPEVPHTYSVVGNMNEHQVSISESTWGGRPELADTTAIMDYGSLIYVGLQRSKTAREAIKVMTTLVEKHGYYSSGESFSIADPNEVWIMEMISKGTDEKGAVWVACRIPDDCIAGHANHARIHQFPLKDSENCIYSKDVIKFARKKGYFSGNDKDFSFSKAYAILDDGALRGCEARVWAFYNTFAKGMDRYLPYLNGEKAEILPLYIKPDKKINVRDMQSMMRNHFEDTPYDMTKDVGAGAWKVPYRYRPLTFKVDGVEYYNERAIATQQTGFSFVSQMRSWLPNVVGGILWFGVDDANTCVYTPMYCAMTEIPNCYAPGNGDLYTFSWTSAFWVHNWVANQAYNRYSLMIPDIRKLQTNLEDNIEKLQPEIEATALKLCADSTANSAMKYLNNYSRLVAESSTTEFRKLGEYLLVKYLDGNMKKERAGKFERTSDNYPVYPYFPGYDKKYYESIVKETGTHLKVKELH
ncbi:MAG: C69 family dipeptidase [Muribaculaceae bacterium]